MPDETLLERVRRQANEYNGLQRWWYGWHYIPGGLGVVAGVLAVVPETAHWIWGAIASLAAGIVTFLGPLRMAERYKRAFHRLDNALCRALADSVPTGHSKEAWLVDELEGARTFVLGGQEAESRPTPPPA